MKTMKGKYMTTSLLLAIMASERSNDINVAETRANTTGHELLWSRESSSANVQARLNGRDELKRS